MRCPCFYLLADPGIAQIGLRSKMRASSVFFELAKRALRLAAGREFFVIYRPLTQKIVTGRKQVRLAFVLKQWILGLILLAHVTITFC